MTDPDAVVREQVVAAPPGEVFRWFIDPDLLARWIGIRPGSLASFLGRRVEGDARRLYRLADPVMAPPGPPFGPAGPAHPQAPPREQH